MYSSMVFYFMKKKYTNAVITYVLLKIERKSICIKLYIRKNGER